MAKKLGDLLKKVYKDADRELPSRNPQSLTPSKPPAADIGNTGKPVTHPHRRATDQAANSPEPPENKRPSVYSPEKRVDPKTPEKDMSPAFTLSIKESSRVLLADDPIRESVRLIKTSSDGRATAAHGMAGDALGNYELTMGFDFGTSSTKVVIGDPQQQKAFAVPFLETTGVERFLLPGRIFKSSEYSLVAGTEVFRDLKLSLLTSTTQDELEHTVAFVALAIRHARAWLFQTYASLYRDEHILWTFSIGMPSAEIGQSSKTKEVLELVALAAWIVSTGDERIGSEQIRAAIDDAKVQRDSDAPSAHLPEVRVYPEIFAQVYGVVSAEGFKARGNDLYLLVDIGAGTVDTSLFKITKSSGNRLKPVPHVSTVEFNGAVNLHRSRIDWWRTAVSAAGRKDLVEALDAAAKCTDCSTRIPLRLEEYVSEAGVHWTRDKEHPDEQFMSKRLRPQILAKTLVEPVKQGHLKRSDVLRIPTYLCGGGMRMPFYKDLLKVLDRRERNASWVHVKPQELTKPERLEASGLAQTDYDRLSVAYGLSLMEVEPVALAESRRDAAAVTGNSASELSYRDAYISKDMI
jgi:hypothetical protein